MSEITAESIVQAHIDALSNLKMGESALIEPLARDAVQAAMLLGYRRANEPEPVVRTKVKERPPCVHCGRPFMHHNKWHDECLTGGKVYEPIPETPQPPTPAQPEGEKPPRDYRDDLLSCAKADAERLRNDARAISTRHREDLRAAEEFGDWMKTERDEAQFDLGNARGELMELHRILETIRRVAGSKP